MKLTRRGYLVNDKTGERFEYDLTEEDRWLFQSMCQDFDGTPEEFFKWANVFTTDILARDRGRPRAPKTYALRDAFKRAKDKKPGLSEREFVVQHFKLDPSDTNAIDKRRAQLRRQNGLGRKIK